MATKLKIANGKSALVDNEYAWLAQFNWRWIFPKESDPYVFGYAKGRSILLHRLVVCLNQGSIPKGMVVHHLNHDTADNRVENLQITTNGDNAYRSQAHEAGRTTSRYRGVDWYKKSRKWRARVRVNQKLVHLGFFSDEIEAAQVAQKAREHYKI